MPMLAALLFALYKEVAPLLDTLDAWTRTAAFVLLAFVLLAIVSTVFVIALLLIDRTAAVRMTAGQLHSLG